MKKKILITALVIILLILGALQYWVGITKIDDEIRVRILAYNNKETEVSMEIVDNLLNNSNYTNPVLATSNTKNGRIYAVYSGSFSDGPSSVYNYKGNFVYSCNGAKAKRLQLPACSANLFDSVDKKYEYFESIENKKYWCRLRRHQGWPYSPECLEVLDIEN